MKMFGILAAVLQEFLLATQAVAKAKPVEGLLEWLLTEKGKEAIKRACETGWVILSESFQSFQVEANKLLEFVGIVSIPATTEKFVAKDKFKLKKDGGICSYLGDNFVAWFLSGDSKTEDLIPATTLRYHKLRKHSLHTTIIAELGGVEKLETTLSAVFSLIEKQSGGEMGALLNYLLANNFYVKDITGVLRLVQVSWVCGDWIVSADSISDHNECYSRSRMFSRN